MQIYVRELSGQTGVYDVSPFATVKSLYDDVYQRSRHPHHSSFDDDLDTIPTTTPFHLVTPQGKWLSHQRTRDTEECSSDADSDERMSFLADHGITHESVLHVHLLIRGGKGGFGTALRTKAKQKGKHDLTDFSACRDLSGRRLRQVNDEQILQKWSRSQDQGAKYDPLQGSSSGIENWFLSTPSWIDVKKRSSYNRILKEKEKTAICQDWTEARAKRRDGLAPSGAPAWWGCPRGARCKFAHGEHELQAFSRHALHASEKHKAEENLRKGQEAYTDTIASSYMEDSALASMIQQGLNKRAKKRPREGEAGDKVDPATTTTTATTTASTGNGGTGSEEGEDEGRDGDGTEVSFPVMCVNGDIDITVDSATMQFLQSHQIPSTQAVYALHGISSFGTAIVTDCAISPPAPALATAKQQKNKSQSTPPAAHAHAVQRNSTHTQSWSYEVILETNGLMQLGWAHSLFLAPNTGPDSTSGTSGSHMKSVGDGVGDDAFSWGWDGSRSQALHGEINNTFPPPPPPPTPAGSGSGGYAQTAWQIGDVIKSTLTMNTQTGAVDISYSVNGNSIGTPFTNIDSKTMQRQYDAAVASTGDVGGNTRRSSSGYFPAFSLEAEERIQLYLNASAPPPAACSAAGSCARTDVTGAYSVAQLVEGVEDAQEGAGVCITTSANADANASSSPSSTGDEQVLMIQAAAAAAATNEPIPLHSATSAHDLESSWTLESLKAELTKRGCKAGGTLAERSERLWAIRDLKDSEIDPKMRAKK